ncbi:histidinol phosphate aminotransferase [Reichenbachiella sp. 5M10]|uniref:pyridoxal phosphate-dependent aminotransferase n=1 Tax=Reichenbachiella sp. 5M10 TaxID=1889772 RepID=UPI000C157E4E|nr:histidinol-phosphate transaminase [Reichenbachiella sp. 5M10]PIB34324.1 histidinol phosphate aminotransferase [Reichenbachiella sp. 5M10]
METKINRRNWLKAGMITAGGLAVSPYFTMAEMTKAPIRFNAKGNALYSPFFEEYVPKVFPDANTLKAKLNANENPYGPSPKAIQAVQEKAFMGNRYAWTELFDLINKIAAKEGVDPKRIMMGPGSSDLLEKTAMVLFMDGGNVVSADPSYMSLIQVAQSTGANWKAIPLKKDWSHDLQAMEKAIDSETKLVYICNPNNPTGSMTDHNELLDFCSRVSEKVPVFIDEAYLGFLDDAAQKSMVSLINEGKNVIIARTFSKIHGMAGLRVGYIVASDKIISQISKITRGGMGISYTSIFAASASMDDVAFQNESRKLNAQARSYVCEELDTLGYKYIPSSTSFVIFPIEMDGKVFLEKMINTGVAVRSFKIMDKTWCRVSIGTMDEMKIFIQSLKQVLV